MPQEETTEITKEKTIPTYATATGPIEFTLKSDMLFHLVMQQSTSALIGLVCALKGIDRSTVKEIHVENPMNHPHRLHVGKSFCYAAWRHEPVGCSMHPAEQGMSTMPLSHWLTFGNTFLKMFAAPFMSAFVIVPS